MRDASDSRQFAAKRRRDRTVPQAISYLNKRIFTETNILFFLSPWPSDPTRWPRRTALGPDTGGRESAHRAAEALRRTRQLRRRTVSPDRALGPSTSAFS